MIFDQYYVEFDRVVFEIPVQGQTVDYKAARQALLRCVRLAFACLGFQVRAIVTDRPDFFLSESNTLLVPANQVGTIMRCRYPGIESVRRATAQTYLRVALEYQAGLGAIGLSGLNGLQPEDPQAQIAEGMDLLKTVDPNFFYSFGDIAKKVQASAAKLENLRRGSTNFPLEDPFWSVEFASQGSEQEQQPTADLLRPGFRQAIRRLQQQAGQQVQQQPAEEDQMQTSEVSPPALPTASTPAEDVEALDDPTLVPPAEIPEEVLPARSAGQAFWTVVIEPTSEITSEVNADAQDQLASPPEDIPKDAQQDLLNSIHALLKEPSLNQTPLPEPPEGMREVASDLVLLAEQMVAACHRAFTAHCQLMPARAELAKPAFEVAEVGCLIYVERDHKVLIPNSWDLEILGENIQAFLANAEPGSMWYYHVIRTSKFSDDVRGIENKIREVSRESSVEAAIAAFDSKWRFLKKILRMGK